MEKQPLPRKIVSTTDGSHTIYIPDLNEHYHSIHGAIQESEHVFIRAGLEAHKKKSDLRILEIGFGTGLNALLTLKYAFENHLNIDFITIEKYPLQPNEYSLLNHGKMLGKDWENLFTTLHECPWEKVIPLTPSFNLTKQVCDLDSLDYKLEFDLIYFDAFGPDVQPELWSEKVFHSTFEALRANGILVTYSAKGQVRRNLLSAGFKVERLPGPPGKREMLRATKH